MRSRLSLTAVRVVLTGVLVVLTSTCAWAQAPAAARSGGPVASLVLAPDVEAALARSGGPPAMGDATVYVWTATGYRMLHEGAGPFTCLVNRDSFLDGYDALKPTCWDAEGSRVIVPIMLFIGEQVAAGRPAAAIQQAVEARFASGAFAAPAAAGVAYMLQGDVGSIDAESGRVLTRLFPPHVMIFGPGVQRADLGIEGPSAMSDARIPFVYRRGAAVGYIIVRVPTLP